MLNRKQFMASNNVDTFTEVMVDVYGLRGIAQGCTYTNLSWWAEKITADQPTDRSTMAAYIPSLLIE